MVVVVLDAIAIVIALLVGGAIGLLLSAAHRQRDVSRRMGFEQEVTQDAELYAAARAGLCQYRPAGPRDNDPTAP